MKTLIVTLLFAAAAFSQEQQQTAPNGQQQQSGKRDRKAGEARRTSMKKLQTDLDQASARAKFTDEQRKQFEDARAALRQQAQQRGGRRSGGGSQDQAGGQGNAREAMRTLRELIQSDAFQAEDRELLRKDFDALRKSGGRNRQGGGGRAQRKSAA